MVLDIQKSISTAVEDECVITSTNIRVQPISDLGTSILTFNRNLLIEAGLPIPWEYNVNLPTDIRNKTNPMKKMSARIVDYYQGSTSH